MILGVTGHRLHKLPGYRGERSASDLRKTLLVLAMDKLEEWHPDLVISGMATGWDLAIAMGAMMLNVPFHAYVPFEGQDKLWPEADRSAYRGLLDEATDVRVFSPIETVAAYHERDMAIVDASTQMLALYGGDPRTGTGRTITYAEGWLVPVSNVMSEFMERLAKTASRPL